MNILAIETSCECASVALMLGTDVIQFKLEGHANHSARLLPTLQRLLSEAELGVRDLDAIAFGAGPGAFTGLRLACGVAQGLAIGADIGVVPVSSLAALGLQGRGEHILVATDARMGELYSAAYRMCDGEPVAVRAEACLPPQALSLPDDNSWFVIGSALRVYPGLLGDASAGRIMGRDATAVPRAQDVAWLAERAVLRGESVAPELALPLYVRDKVALTTAERMAKGGRA